MSQSHLLNSFLPLVRSRTKNQLKLSNETSVHQTNVEEPIQSKPNLETALDKVNGLLKAFAEEKRKSLHELNLLDLSGGDGQLSKDLIDFVKEYYLKPTTAQSQLSYLRALIKSVYCPEETTKDSVAPRITEADLPSFMRPIWKHLGRTGGKAFYSLRHSRVRDKAPLSEESRIVVEIFLLIREEHKINDLQNLLVNNADLLVNKVNSIVPYEKRQNVRSQIIRVRRGCGFRLPKKNSPRKINELTPQLSRDIQNFLERAHLGIESDPILARLAAEFKHKNIAPLRRHTIESYKCALLKGLGIIEWEGDIGIEDFLRLDPVEVNLMGRVIIDERNQYMDQFRQHERSKSNRYKGTNYDSEMFSLFIRAVKAVAAYKGIFELHEPFNRKYKLNLDKKTKEARKAAEREVFSAAWWDRNIKEMKKKFDEVILRDSFKEIRKDLKLVLFLPQLVVLRYLGYRQQCTRNCDYGRHIIINRDSSISFRWDEGEIKNSRAIDAVYSEKEHVEIAELMLLIDVLTKYYKFVRGSWLKENFGHRLGQAFFCYVDINGGVLKFDPEDGARQYARIFRILAKDTMNFDGLLLKDVTPHPHLLRAICCTWLRDDIDMPWDDIEDVIGDKRATLEREYYGKSKKSGGTKAFAKINKLRTADKKQQQLEREQMMERVSSDSRISALQEAIGMYKERLEIETKNREAKETENLQLHRQNATLLHEKMMAGKNWPSLPEWGDFDIDAAELYYREKFRAWRAFPEVPGAEVDRNLAITMLGKLNSRRLGIRDTN